MTQKPKQTTKLQQALALLPDGYYVHTFTKFVNGTVRTTRKGTAHVPIEIGIEQLGSPFPDFRAVLNPQDNRLVPLLLFIDPEVVAAQQPPDSAQCRVPDGWRVKRVGDAIHIERPNGQWCGYMHGVDGGPAHDLTYDFLSAMLPPPDQQGGSDE